MINYKISRRLLAFSTAILLLTSLVFPVYANDLTAGENVYVGGMPFGVKIMTGTMTVSGFTQVDGEKGPVSPSSDAGLCENDIILKINGCEISAAEDVTRTVEDCGGKEITFLIRRGGKELTVKVVPVKSSSCGKYRIGMWIKDSTAGIGTVTYVVPETGYFGGLGHGICDSDTGALISVKRGIVSNVTISGITKGKAGTPGELKGFFSPERIGVVTGNTDNGVFGLFTDITSLKEKGELIPLASKDETKSGEATILCTLDSNAVGRYTAEIICDKNAGDGKSFSVIITDSRLLEKTGGIIQGMSGSPIIQNGKLVGAVTHVLVNDPTKGYGIFIEDMLNASCGVSAQKDYSSLAV